MYDTNTNQTNSPLVSKHLNLNETKKILQIHPHKQKNASHLHLDGNDKPKNMILDKSKIKQKMGYLT